jgi:hypothetical protein
LIICCLDAELENKKWLFSNKNPVLMTGFFVGF